MKMHDIAVMALIIALAVTSFRAEICDTIALGSLLVAMEIEGLRRDRK